MACPPWPTASDDASGTLSPLPSSPTVLSPPPSDGHALRGTAAPLPVLPPPPFFPPSSDYHAPR
eukprot:7566550-Pyramimonas_sp.AAC.1